MIIQLGINVDIPDSVDIYSKDAEPSVYSNQGRVKVKYEDEDYGNGIYLEFYQSKYNTYVDTKVIQDYYMVLVDTVYLDDTDIFGLISKYSALIKKEIEQGKSAKKMRKSKPQTFSNMVAKQRSKNKGIQKSVDKSAVIHELNEIWTHLMAIHVMTEADPDWNPIVSELWDAMVNFNRNVNNKEN